MGKNDHDDELDKETRKRLQETRKRLQQLRSKWDEKPSDSWKLSDKLSPADLRLLLEHFAPLQDLIRAIVAAPAGAAAAEGASQITALPARLAEAEDKLRHANAALARLQSELEQTRADRHNLQKDLANCNATTRQLLRDKEELQKRLRQAETDLAACHAERKRDRSPPAELALLRDDTNLARQLGLAELPTDDTQALIQVVAVLAQRDSLERLWDALKERCEAHNRSASPAERALLNAALTWYNHNWRTRPYRLHEAAPHTAFDYDRHLRSRHTSTGEKIIEQRLPGIADGSGNPLRKPLVITA